MEYIITSTACLSFCFLIYKLIYRNEKNFIQLRIFLLASIIISLLIPLSEIGINIGVSFKPDQINTVFSPESSEKTAPMTTNSTDFKDPSIQVVNTEPIQPTINWRYLLITAYMIVSAIILIRLILQLIIILSQFFNSQKTKRENMVIINNPRFKTTFSFFKWIFINTELSLDNETDDILAHEKIHAIQLHSIDLIIIELLLVIMWFNPFIWMIKREMQLVHEYLADEGALNTGIDKLRYQALLINQATEERLICLSSSFNHSLIKKRMIMMTKSKFNRKTKLKILTLIPLATILFLVVACVNEQEKTTNYDNSS